MARDEIVGRVAVTVLLVLAIAVSLIPGVRWCWRQYCRALDWYEADLAERHGGE